MSILPLDVIDGLAALGTKADEDVPLYEAALLLSSMQHPGQKLEKYRHHIGKLYDEVAARHRILLEAGAMDTIETRLAALKHVIVDTHNYTGDAESPAHIQNADMIRVVDRGRGGPVALAILYMDVAAAQGWPAFGLDIPGSFAVRMDKAGRRIIFDPFGGCVVLQAPDLRRMVKQARGPQAELSASYYEAMPRRAILVRLQNHIKLRQIEAEDYEGALQSVEAMRALDPAEYRLLLDAGVMYARTGRRTAAIDALEEYIRKAPDIRDRQEAALLLNDIRSVPQ